MSIPPSSTSFGKFSVADPIPSASLTQITEKTDCKRNPDALDVLYMTTSDSGFKDISVKLKNQAQSSGVPMEVLYVERLEGSSKKEKIARLRDDLHKLHQDGKIDENTQIIIHLHGSIDDGPHDVAGRENIFSIDTQQLVSLIRKSKAPAGMESEANRWNGTIHISACGVAKIGKSISNDAGLTLLYGGSKVKLVIESEAIFTELIRQLGEYRKDSENKSFPTARQFYTTAGSISGEKVSLSGDGELCQIRSGFLPPASTLHLQPVMDKLEKSLIAKLCHGKVSNFRNMVDLLGAAVQHIKFIPPLEVLATSAPNDAEAKLKILLRAGVDINQALGSGKVALHHAVGAKQTEMAKLLIKHGADANLTDARGDSPLGLALRSRQSDMAEYLIEAGGNILAVTGSRESALHLAVDNGDVRLVNLLLAKGANPLAEDDLDVSPLQIAVKANRFDLVDLMLPHVANGANPTQAFDRSTLIAVLSAKKSKNIFGYAGRPSQ
jgi:ankyrin repeat protein